MDSWRLYLFYHTRIAIYRLQTMAREPVRALGSVSFTVISPVHFLALRHSSHRHLHHKRRSFYHGSFHSFLARNVAAPPLCLMFMKKQAKRHTLSYRWMVLPILRLKLTARIPRMGKRIGICRWGMEMRVTTSSPNYGEKLYCVDPICADLF